MAWDGGGQGGLGGGKGKLGGGKGGPGGGKQGVGQRGLGEKGNILDFHFIVSSAPTSSKIGLRYAKYFLIYNYYQYIRILFSR